MTSTVEKDPVKATVVTGYTVSRLRRELADLPGDHPVVIRLPEGHQHSDFKAHCGYGDEATLESIETTRSMDAGGSMAYNSGPKVTLTIGSPTGSLI